ncbi:MAG: hypothetical protein HY742_08810 [Deltaproteobacteria bacterium]|nr:hypothetical protein [Deltaproteobacteria bacterium]
MGRVIKKPEDVFAEITADFNKAFGKDMLSLILFGSGADGTYVPGKSDLNFLVIVTDEGIKELDRAVEIVKKWRKRRVATPLILAKTYVLSALDSFPVEFFGIRRNHILVYGEDFVSGLSFEACDLRLQLERELKAKILHLRQGFLESEGKEKHLRHLVQISLKSFISLFRVLLFLKCSAIPVEKREIVGAVAKALFLDVSVFEKCLDVSEGRDRFSVREIRSLFQAYMEEIDKLSDIVDRME